MLRTQINAFEYYLNTIKPDVINFHEFDNLNTILLQKCMERNIKCVITNHLYIGNSHGCSNYTNIRDIKRKCNLILKRTKIVYQDVIH